MTMCNHHIQKLGLNILTVCFLLVGGNKVQGQSASNNTAYNFLELPYSAKATALGGLNISSMGTDLGLAMFNPSLLNEQMNNTLHLSVKPFYTGIQQYDLAGVNYWERKKISFAWGVHYMDYGNILMTDIAGNELGNMHPNDYAVQLSAAGPYIENFQIGGTLKYIHSNYGLYKSSGLAMDIALKYLAPSKLSQASLLVKNMGTKGMPFNIILGWSKKLAYAPIQFSITADRLAKWNNLYYDANYALAMGELAPGKLQNLFNHLIIASELYIGNQVDINIGYNFMRRYDLNVQSQANGMNGFSTGLGLRLERTYVQYGTAFFQKNMYHHFSINYQLKK